MRNLMVLLLIFSLLSCSRNPGGYKARIAKRATHGACPNGFIKVPDSSYNKSFCVSKYESSLSAGKAVSSTSGVPASLRSLSAAKAACEANGLRYKLITNLQWQSIARNIESVSKNWSSGKVGFGALSLGHSDGAPEGPLVPGADTNGCFGLNNDDCSPSDWSFQKRTHLLSNGETIWDFAGNLQEWVADVADLDLSELEGSTLEIQEIDDTEFKKAYGPNSANENLDLSLAGGFGVISVDSMIDDYAVGIVRGGGFNSEIESGVFSIRANVPAETDEYDVESLLIGFRCTFQP